MKLSDQIVADIIKNQAPTMPLWATYIVRRRPQFKMHSAEGHAKNAIGCKWPGQGGIIFKFVEGQWQQYMMLEPPIYCAKCGDPFATGFYSGRNPKARREIYNFKLNKLKFWQRPLVCTECYDKHYGYCATDRLDPMDLLSENNSLS